MAFTLLTPINSLCFLSELDRIDIGDVTDESLDFSVSTVLGEIFHNVYVPDAGGCVRIYAISKLLKHHLDHELIRINKFMFTIGDETFVTTVVPCSVSLPESAEEFVPASYLTLMQGDKQTSLDRYETLTPYVETSTPVTVVANYFDGSVVKEDRISLPSVFGSAPIDVSASRFVNEALGTLISYAVHCGRRKAVYRLWPRVQDSDPAFIFRNCFGCWETIYLTGTKTKQPQYTRSSAMIDGQYRVYDIEEEVQCQAYTGPLRGGMDEVASDLLRSEDVYLLNADGSAGDRVEILDCDFKISNEPDALPEAQITYRLASKRAKVDVCRPPKIFDTNFDQNFE